MDQNVQISSTEVHQSDRTDQTGRPVYRFDQRSSGKELRLEPRPDDRTDQTTDRLPRQARQAKTDGRARINFEREESDSDSSFSLSWPAWLVPHVPATVPMILPPCSNQ
ncbi:hypothetical protein F2Q69_00012800 [Brassica cretica]|uniref:Uncharacterized protein n=1 Tax=Brassica cretica TaxID=69181 RepID=A0A8S9QFJ7_BRACR|nr:hypothetical protein F2Q69_00012800 [Brassica cretica]